MWVSCACTNDSVTFLKNQEIEIMRFGSAWNLSESYKGNQKGSLSVLFSPNILLNKRLLVKRESGSTPILTEQGWMTH